MRSWRTIRLFMTSTIVLTALTGITQAQPRVETPPDWPCVQVFVPTLSAATIWAGPPVDDYLKTWTENRDVAALATRVVPAPSPTMRPPKLSKTSQRGSKATARRP